MRSTGRLRSVTAIALLICWASWSAGGCSYAPPAAPTARMQLEYLAAGEPAPWDGWLLTDRLLLLLYEDAAADTAEAAAEGIRLQFDVDLEGASPAGEAPGRTGQ